MEGKSDGRQARKSMGTERTQLAFEQKAFDGFSPGSVRSSCVSMSPGNPSRSDKHLSLREHTHMCGHTYWTWRYHDRLLFLENGARTTSYESNDRSFVGSTHSEATCLDSQYFSSIFRSIFADDSPPVLTPVLTLGERVPS